MDDYYRNMIESEIKLAQRNPVFEAEYRMNDDPRDPLRLYDCLVPTLKNRKYSVVFEAPKAWLLLCYFLQAFFKHRDRPTTNGARCDACRAIAFRLDKAFDFAESHISVDGAREGHTTNGLPELSGEEVTTIASYICSKNTFSDVKPFKVRHKNFVLLLN